MITVPAHIALLPPRRLCSRGALALACALGVAALPLRAADIVIQPAAGSGFVVKDAVGTNERLRVQESGTVSLPAVPAAPPQPQGLCMSTGGQLGPCSGSTGGSYTAGTGLTLTGNAFSVAPTYRLPQSCAANQIAQWNGSAWTCGSATGGTLPPGTVNQTLRYNASNALVADDLLQAFADGGLLAGGTFGTGTIPTEGAGVRMMWYPGKAAFRMGGVSGGQWNDANVGPYSMAVGHNTVATADDSVAMGLYTEATGAVSLATGATSKAIGDYSTAMGALTTASGKYSTAMGFQTTASGGYSTAMGYRTTASETASFATGLRATANGIGSVAMGGSVVAQGSGSVALGNNVTAAPGTFIFGDGSARTPFPTKNNQFVAIATNGVEFYTTTDYVFGAKLAPGSSSWTAFSDRNGKTAVRAVDPREVLNKVVALPLNTWQYKTQDAKYRHMGPMAQDFYAAFRLGETDKGIDTVDADGVALAAIQGLNDLLAEKNAKVVARLDEKDREIEALRAELANQKARVASLESLAVDLADVKAKVAALSGSSPTTAAVALRQP